MLDDMTNAPATSRAARLCRSWLFVAGADRSALEGAADSGADALIQELEDFTPASLRPEARALAGETYARWRRHGRLVAVRINPLAGDGGQDLAEVMRSAPDVVALPKVSDPGQVRELDRAVTRLERTYGLAEGSTRLMPNIELARGLIQTYAIARASERVAACLLASEDLAADLGAERGRDAVELAYARQRFLVECVAAGDPAVDSPNTYRDAEGLVADTRWARRLGYRSKSCVEAAHAALVNDVLTPSSDEVAQARRIVDAFDAARARGEPRAEVDGLLVEVPTYLNAQRLLVRSRELSG
jgi:citrate lyase subunit beta/citryl-CoA lyase